MTDEQPILEDFKDINLEQIIFDELVAELKEHNDKYLTDIMIHPDVFKRLENVFYKKIKRRIFYEVIWWGAERRHTKCFYSVKKMRKFVNELHSWYNDYIEIEKTWCYREYSPRHKWYYISFEPNQFVCVEKW